MAVWMSKGTSLSRPGVLSSLFVNSSILSLHTTEEEEKAYRDGLQESTHDSSSVGSTHTQKKGTFYSSFKPRWFIHKFFLFLFFSSLSTQESYTYPWLIGICGDFFLVRQVIRQTDAAHTSVDPSKKRGRKKRRRWWWGGEAAQENDDSKKEKRKTHPST